MITKNLSKRLVALLLALTMVIGLVPDLAIFVEAAASEDSVVVIAGSDFQNKSGNDASAETVKSILTQIQSDYSTADGFLFAGDYTVTTNSEESRLGREKLRETVQAMYTEMKTDNMVWVQGNHDPDSMVGGLLSNSGANDSDDYGVFVINEQDYMWYNNDLAEIKKTASELDAYLDAKVAEKYNKPIFVISHLPLHYTMRTSRDGDSMYANHLFDVLNEAGELGLNIIWLSGHNHSQGWDDYMGGGAYFLHKGDQINIAQDSRTDFDVETLNFTYMNAGYTGYYEKYNEGTIEDLLTMTAFEITDDEVIVTRYTPDGIYNLKDAGVSNAYHNETAYSPNTKVYSSSQTIKLNKFVSDTSTGVAVNASGVTSVSVEKVNSSVPEEYSAYATYDITPAGYTDGTKAVVSVPVDSSFDVSRPVTVIDHEKSTTQQVWIVNDTVTFTTNHFSQYSIVQVVVSESGAVEGYTEDYLEEVSVLTDGKPYIITDYNKNWNLTGETATYSSGNTNATGLYLSETIDMEEKWYYHSGELHYLDDSSKILSLSSAQGMLQESNYQRVNEIFYDANYQAFILRRTLDNDGSVREKPYYLNRYGGGTSHVAAGYSGYNSGAYDKGCAWNFYDIVSDKVTLSVSASVASLNAGESAVISPVVKVNDVVTDNYTIQWTTSDSTVAVVTNGLVTPINGGEVTITATLTEADGHAMAEALVKEIPISVVPSEEFGVTASATLVERVTELEENVPYIITDKKYNMILTGTHVENELYPDNDGLQLLDFDYSESELEHIWYVKDGKLVYKDASDTNSYLNMTSNDATLGSETADTVANNIIKNTDGTFTIGVNTSYYLNQYGGQEVNKVASVYSGANTSKWYFNKIDKNTTVTLSVKPITSILKVGETKTLTPIASLNGVQSSDYKVTWSSSNTDIATVSSSGVITAVSKGSVEITASLTYVGGHTLAEAITVSMPITVTTESVSGNTTSVFMGEYLIPVTELEEGVEYIISSYHHSLVLTHEDGAVRNSDLGVKLVPSTDYESLSTDAPKWTLKNGNLVCTIDGVENYLSIRIVDGVKEVYIDSSATNAVNTVVLNTDNKTYTIYNSNVSGYYLNQLGGTINDRVAGLWGQDGNGTKGSAWYFNTVGGEAVASLNVAPGTSTVYIDETMQQEATVFFNGDKLSDYEVEWASSDTSIFTVYEGKIYPKNAGEAMLKVTVTAINGRVLSEEEQFSVNVPITVAGVTAISLDQTTGSVAVGSSVNANTDATMTVTYSDGVTKVIPIKVGMVTDADGNVIGAKTAGTYENSSITYKGVTVSGFTYIVDELTEDDPGYSVDYPEYPEEGSVSVDKTGAGKDFQSSGIAEIELSATGVPSKKGADVIIMLDSSSSMATTITGSKYDRTQVLTQSLNNLINKFQEVGEDGELQDVRVAVADFNGYYEDENSNYYLNPDDILLGNYSQSRPTTEKVYTGNETISADAFVSVHEMGLNPFTCAGYDGDTTSKYNIVRGSGTNYDYAFDVTYQLGEAIRDKNAAEYEDRDLFVIFMSDGCPFQFNYFSSQSSEKYNSTLWNKWITGTLDEENDYAANANRTYYNEDGKHWMAEVIKGDTNEMYNVIRKNDERDTDGDNWIQVEGLGAKMYAIGFCLADDNEIKRESMDIVIQNIASGPEYYYVADTAEQLEDSFNSIRNEIFYAATEAYFVDTMGVNYDLQLATSTYVGSDNENHTITPEIQVKAYEIYTNNDYENEICTIDQVGTRKKDADGNYIYKLIEKVTFSEDGAKAYSDVIGATTDIMKDGVICANTFWYNTTSSAVTITLENNQTYSLPAETFYWKLGTISTTELTLSYYVYLTGSMEGTRAAGIYDTNESAILYYKNYKGNDCQQSVPTPKLPWKQATVGYGFYLVDEQGNPVVNQTTGQTGSFENAVKITQPVYETFYLNSGTQDIIATIVSGEVLPDGYTLFDGGAEYEVKLNSNGNGYYIIYTDSATGKQTTYVVGVEQEPVINSSEEEYTEVTEDGVTKYYQQNETSGYATAATVVWFGVVATVSCIPDAVVIDYGLPVDIHVLANDIMMTTANTVLAGIGKTAPTYLQPTVNDGNTSNASMESGYVSKDDVLAKDTNSLQFGNAQIMDAGTEDTNKATVRYSLDTMSMNEEEVFYYAAYYTGEVGTHGYYYSTVTVIPATMIYYEDNFITLNDGTDGTANEQTTGTWVQTYDNAEDKAVSEGHTTIDSNVTQSEDRPGFGSLSNIDANNIYGFDPVYNSNTLYSLGSAAKVTVSADNNPKNGGSWPTAEFTFTGTGFDVISISSGTSGTITVSVYDEENTLQENWIVDTYYGYEYIEPSEEYPDGQWVVTDNADTLYQVPVIKSTALEYGTYRVVITPLYSVAFDHREAGTYSFWLDAIRIYDPAGTTFDENDVVGNAYLEDNEAYPDYEEVRNLLIDAEDFNEGLTDAQAPGIVFIDGYGSADGGTTTGVVNYTNEGPNNEVYLKGGQAIAFHLTATAIPDDVHLAMKLAKGSSVKVAVAAADGKQTNVKIHDIQSATDLYFDISDVVVWATEEDADGNITYLQQEDGMYYTKYPVIIYNASDDTSTSILSITTLKWTFETLGEMGEHPTVSPIMTVEDAPVVYSNLRSLLGVASEEPEESTPEEPEETTPEEPEESTPEEPEESTPEEPEESTPEEPEESTPEEPEESEDNVLSQVVAQIVKAVSEVVKAIKNIFKGWFS